MLFKTIVQQYGASLNGTTKPSSFDLVHFAGHSNLRDPYRQEILDDLTGAKKYLLDHRAAEYLESFRQQLQGDITDKASDELMAMVKDIDPPSQLIWIELDHKELSKTRRENGLEILDEDLDTFGLRGFLLDFRDSEIVKAQLFKIAPEGGIIDPIVSLDLRKKGGRPDLTNIEPGENAHMTLFFQAMGYTPAQYRDLAIEEVKIIAFEIVLCFLFFASLASNDEGLLAEEAASLTPREQKTARKFGKTWLTDALRSHTTIRIGPQGQAHLGEIKELRARASTTIQERQAPIEHTVRAHLRHYKDGKIVLVRPHKRGRKSDENLPTRVTRPRTS